MGTKDEFRYLVSGYFGIEELNNYDEKVYILKEIEKYIKDYIEINEISDIDFYKEANDVKENNTAYRKLQDSLLVLPKVKAPLEVILLVRKKLKELEEDEGIHGLQ